MGFLTRYDGELREPLVWHQGSQVSMRMVRGNASLLSSHGRGIGIQDALKEDSESFSGCVRKPWVPSTCAGDLRELLRVPLRSRDTVDLGGASRASTVFGVMEEGLISSGVRKLRVPLHFGLRSRGPFRVGTGVSGLVLSGGMEICLPLKLFMG